MHCLTVFVLVACVASAAAFANPSDDAGPCVDCGNNVDEVAGGQNRNLLATRHRRNLPGSKSSRPAPAPPAPVHCRGVWSNWGACEGTTDGSQTRSWSITR